MVVSQPKPNGKMRTKQQALEQSQTGEASSKHSSLAMPRVANQSKQEGKRKATHRQPVVSISETSKTYTSNLNKSNLGKGAKGTSSRDKVNQKAKDIVGSQPNEVGLSFKTGSVSIGLGKGFISVDGACQGPFVFSSPTGAYFYAEAKNKEADTNSKGSHNGGERQIGDFLQREDHSCGG